MGLAQLLADPGRRLRQHHLIHSCCSLTAAPKQGAQASQKRKLRLREGSALPPLPVSKWESRGSSQPQQAMNLQHWHLPSFTAAWG